MCQDIGTIKLLVQNNGVYIDDILAAEINERYNHFDARMGKVFFYFNVKGAKIPVYAEIKNKKNGFPIKKNQDVYSINIGGHSLDFNFYDRKDAYNIPIGGKLAGDIIRIKADDHLALTFNHDCKHFEQRQQCKFCNIHKWPSQTNSTLDELVNVAYLYQEEHAIKHISITGGTGNGVDKGLLNVINFIQRLRKKGVTLPIGLEFEPTSETHLFNELNKLGVTTVSCNLEFASDDLRLRLMPGKGLIPFNSYIDTWESCINVFGKNQVYTNILLINDDDETMFMPQIKKIIDVGVIPSIGILLEQEGASIKVFLPEIKKQINYFKETVAYLKKQNLNPRLAMAGCIKNGGYSPLNEFYGS